MTRNHWAKWPFFQGIAIVLLSFALQQCSSSLLVKTDYDKDADFSQYKTFAFYKYEDKQASINELNKRRIHNAIEEELARKGIKLSNEPGLLVNIYTLIQKQQGVTVAENGGGVGMYGGFGPYGSGFGISYSAPRTYHVPGYASGDVVIDLVDRRTMKLVMQGVVTTTVQQGDNDVDRKITYAVKKVFKKIPDLK